MTTGRYMPSTYIDYITTKVTMLDDIKQRVLVETFYVYAAGGKKAIKSKWHSYEYWETYMHKRNIKQAR